MVVEKDLKKDLLNLYKQTKELLKCYEKPLTRREFLEATGMSCTPIEKEFGTYTNFIEIAEEFFLSKLPKAERALLSERSKKFDPKATAEDCINDLRKLKESFPTKHISRNFYRENGKYSDSTWNSHFGTFSEFRRQAGLELTRHQHKLEQQIAKHASVDHYSKYYSTEVAPYYRKYEKQHVPTKFKRIMVFSDVHDKECCEFTLEVFLAECGRKQPDIIVLNGDIFDLLEFGSYTNDPRHVDVVGRFTFVHERLFAPLREKCPDAQIDFIVGNHEHRLVRHLADSSPYLRILLSDLMGISFSTVFGLDKYKINFVSKFDLRAFTKKDIEQNLRKNYQVYFDCYCVCHEPDPTLMKAYSGTNGHHHAISIVSGYNPHVGHTTWVQTPAGHVPDAEYLKHISKWNTGFLDVIINTETKEVVQYPRQTHKTWTEIDGIIYSRNNE